MSKKELTPEQKEMIKGLAAMYVKVDHPTPILESPTDYGLEFKDITFPSLDGTKLAAWFMPAENSDKLIICNHPSTFNRSGFPGHLEPWSAFSDVRVNFYPIYKALVNAGYNVLTYDLRNHGESASADNNVCGTGQLEYQDVVGAMKYVQQSEELKKMTVGLFNPCAGGNSAMVAMTKHPEYFEDVKAFVCAQPASMHIMSGIALKGMGLEGHLETLDDEQVKLGGFKSRDMSPHHYAPSVNVPTFVIQVKDDVWTIPDDVQKTYDLLGTEEKKLFWVEGTTKRFDGYNYFGENPEQMIEWFDRFMK